MRGGVTAFGSNALRIFSRSGGLLNFTKIRVAPVHSIPLARPPRTKYPTTPINSMTHDPSMKYHFLPNQSNEIFLKISTYSSCRPDDSQENAEGVCPIDCPDFCCPVIKP